LPFGNPSGDEDTRYLADLMAEDLAADLSRLPGAFVATSGNVDISAALVADIRRIGADLGVTYLIRGSVRGSKTQTGVNLQLIDATTGIHIWAERFDIDHDGATTVRDEITGRLARTVSAKLIDDVSSSLDALSRDDWTPADLVIYGEALLNRPISVKNRHDALMCFEEALARDPDAAAAKLGIAFVLVGNLGHLWSQSTDTDEARTEQLLVDVIATKDHVPEAHFCMGILRRQQGRLRDSRAELEITIGMLPHYISAFGQLGITLSSLGQPEAAIPCIEKNLRLAPHNPGTPIYQFALGNCHLMLGRVEEAIVWIRRARAGNPRLFYVHITLAAALGLANEMAEAKTALRCAIDLLPAVNSLSSLRSLWSRQLCPESLVLYESTIFTGLRRIGFQD
jgi:adenylate cyclase